MQHASQILMTENRALTEGRRPVIETVIGVPYFLEPKEAADAKRGKGKALYGIVGEADKANANRRVYPTNEWRKNIKAAYDGSGSTGFIIGAVDHQGSCEGGNLKFSPIVWHKLEIQQNGLVYGEFEIAEGHSAGKDLKAIIDAGGRVGFSTYGYASAHRPTSDERIKYQLPELELGEDDDGHVVIDEWELIKIDAVDNPAVRSAWLMRDSAENQGFVSDGAHRVPGEFSDADLYDAAAIQREHALANAAAGKNDLWVAQAVADSL